MVESQQKNELALQRVLHCPTDESFGSTDSRESGEQADSCAGHQEVDSQNTNEIWKSNTRRETMVEQLQKSIDLENKDDDLINRLIGSPQKPSRGDEDVYDMGSAKRLETQMKVLYPGRKTTKSLNNSRGGGQEYQTPTRRIGMQGCYASSSDFWDRQ